MQKHIVPTPYCRCGACSYVRRVKGCPAQTGLADLPGFAESLRLLVAREEYTLSDIAMMFGVSRERIRQLVARLGIPMHQYPKGEHAVRVWDDVAHRFRPVSKKVLRDQRRESTRQIRVRVREGYRQHVLAALATVPTDRPASIREIWHAVSGEWVTSIIASVKWGHLCQMARIPQRYDAFKNLLAQYNLTLYGVGQAPPERKPKGPRGDEEAIFTVLWAHREGLRPRDIEATVGIPRKKAYWMIGKYAN